MKESRIGRMAQAVKTCPAVKTWANANVKTCQARENISTRLSIQNYPPGYQWLFKKMTTRARKKGVEAPGTRCQTESGAAPKPAPSKEYQGNDMQTEDYSDSIYGWNYKGPAILGRAVEFDTRSIVLFRLVTTLNVLWDVCFEFLPDAGWFLTDEGSYSRRYYIAESNKEQVADWSLYMVLFSLHFACSFVCNAVGR